MASHTVVTARADWDTWINRIATGWAIVAVALTGIHQIASISEPFSYRMAWVTADVATMARSFVRQGFLIPVNNNPPIGSEVSAYLHWPPSAPIVLGVWYRVFGISETSTHAFSLAVSVITGAGLWLLARLALGRIGANIALIAWCLLPVNIEYLHLPSQQAVGMALAIYTLICAIRFNEQGGRHWLLLGVTLMGGAVASTWEAAFFGPGLIIAGRFIVFRPTITRTGLYYSLAATITAGGILVAYILTYPNLFGEMSGTVLYRLGLAHRYGDGILHLHAVGARLNATSMLHMIGHNLLSMLGALGLLGLGVAVAAMIDLRREQIDWRAPTAIVSTAVPWLVWYAMFPNHVSIHDFESSIAAPSVALALAWCLVNIFKNPPSVGSSWVWRLALAFALPAVSLAPLLADTASAINRSPQMQPDSELVEQGKEIGRMTEPGSVIVTPAGSPILMFYSERHFIRLVADDDALSRMLPLILRNFAPHTPVYLAISKDEEYLFPSTLRQGSEHICSPHVMLVRLNFSR
jgi:hypothetical protein